MNKIILICTFLVFYSCSTCRVKMDGGAGMVLSKNHVIVPCGKCQDADDFNKKFDPGNVYCPLVRNKKNEGIYQVLRFATHTTQNRFVFATEDTVIYIKRDFDEKELVKQLMTIGLSARKSKVKCRKLKEFRDAYVEKKISF